MGLAELKRVGLSVGSGVPSRLDWHRGRWLEGWDLGGMRSLVAGVQNRAGGSGELEVGEPGIRRDGQFPRGK